MKTLKVFKGNFIEEYMTGEKSQMHPQEFVKDIIYNDGNFTVTFSENGDWFKSFVGFPCELWEMNEMSTKTNKEKLQGK